MEYKFGTMGPTWIPTNLASGKIHIVVDETENDFTSYLIQKKTLCNSFLGLPLQFDDYDELDRSLLERLGTANYREVVETVKTAQSLCEECCGTYSALTVNHLSYESARFLMERRIPTEEWKKFAGMPLEWLQETVPENY